MGGLYVAAALQALMHNFLNLVAPRKYGSNLAVMPRATAKTRFDSTSAKFLSWPALLVLGNEACHLSLRLAIMHHAVDRVSSGWYGNDITLVVKIAH